MKKTAMLLLAIAASLTLAFAGNSQAKNTFSKHYDFDGFTSLSVSNSFHVDFTFSDKWSVDVTVPDFIQPYLKVTCAGSKLRIRLEKLPKDVQRKLNNLSEPLQAKISMPKLLSLSLSGACHFTAEGTQVLKDEALFIDVSGASRIHALETSGNGTLSLDISGASGVVMTADFNLVNVDLSGASNLDLTGNSGKMNIDCSGASDGQIDGDVLVANVDLSGSSKLEVNGNTGKLTLDQSGASKFNSTGETAQARVEVSGAAKCRLTVTESLDYEVSGASTLRVKDKGAKISGETSRGSKLTFER